MEFNLRELEIIEKLLSNRLNADFDPDIDKLRNKVRDRIDDIKRYAVLVAEWAGKT